MITESLKTFTLFHDKILCAGEIMFVPHQSECSGTALSDVRLLVHKFNNTVCRSEKCILSYLYTHKQTDPKIYCCKLTAPDSLQTLMSSVTSYIEDEKHDPNIWHLKHEELIWVFTSYFDPDELRSFFHPMTDEQVPFKSLVMTHYHKVNTTDELASLCGYPIHTFRRIFKKEFGNSVYKWLIQKLRRISNTVFLKDIFRFQILFSSLICHLRNNSNASAKSILVIHPLTLEKGHCQNQMTNSKRRIG